MKFTVDPKIFEKFPGVEIGVIVIKGMDNSGRSEEILKLLREEEAKQKKLLADTEMGSLPEIAVWREIYRSFGSHPKDFRSSVEALLRRARAGNKGIPHINNLVDLYNYISLKYHLPVGAEDLDKIKGDLKLTFASGNEEGLTIGSEYAEKCDPGEVIYRDNESFICRKWNWREADRTKIEANTVNAFLVIEKAPGVGQTLLKKVLEETDEFIKKQLKGQTEINVLAKEKQETEFTFQPVKVKTQDKDNNPAKPTKIPGKNTGKSSLKPTVSKVLQNPLLEGTEGETKAIIRSVIEKAVSELFTQVDMTQITLKIEHPENKDYGDYSTNLALILSGTLKIKPLDVAGNLERKIDEYIRQHQTISLIPHSKELKKTMVKVSDVLEMVKSAPPGFLNFYVSLPYLSNQLERVLTTKKPVRTIQNLKVMVEFTDPNPFKIFHIGHLYSNAVGESISRTLEHLGAQVKRANYFGDVGMHVAKSLWGLKELLAAEKLTLTSLGKKDLRFRVEFLGRAYVLGATAYEEKEKAKEEMKKVNYLVFISAQEYLKKKFKFQPQVDYRKFVGINPKDYKEYSLLFQKGREWSLEYFETIYQILGTKFDYYYPESLVGEYGLEEVKKGLKDNVFEESEGAVVFRGEEYGLHTRVFINSLNLPTYETKELGLAIAKYRDYPYDFSLIVTAKEINEYFEVLFAVLKLTNPKMYEKNLHLGHGMVRLPEGKMSSRTGKIITGEDLLNMVKDKVKEKLDQNRSNYSNEEYEMIAEKASVAAVKYSLLKVALPADIVFDLDKSVNFEGDSGPYLLYTYARCQSVLRKAAKDTSGVAPIQSGTPAMVEGINPNPEENNLLRSFTRFEEVVLEAGRHFAPNLICTYLYDLAQKFNLFYQKHSILSASESQSIQFRLALTQATATLLKKGLHLLGIETVERM